MNDLFKYYEGELKDFIAEALVTKDTLIKRVISPASENLIASSSTSLTTTPLTIMPPATP